MRSIHGLNGVFIVGLLVGVALALPAPGGAQERPGGRGTAKVDGFITPGEWDDAATAEVQVRDAAGKAARGTECVQIGTCPQACAVDP